MFKLAYGAGHNDKTANGIPTGLHKPFMNEWRLNDRVARYFAEAAARYEDVELLRVDDPMGQEPVSLYGRSSKANDWGANFFLSIHHDAGINGGKGGGMTVYCNPGSKKGKEYQKSIYSTCKKAGALKGRSSPMLERGFIVLQTTKMPAVLVECGFMDSTTDVPVILTEEYARAMAYAMMEGIAATAGLKLKPEADPENKKIYRVQVGAYDHRENAEAKVEELKKKGEEGFIVTVERPADDQAETEAATEETQEQTSAEATAGAEKEES